MLARTQHTAHAGKQAGRQVDTLPVVTALATIITNLLAIVSPPGCLSACVRIYMRAKTERCPLKHRRNAETIGCRVQCAGLGSSPAGCRVPARLGRRRWYCPPRPTLALAPSGERGARSLRSVPRVSVRVRVRVRVRGPFRSGFGLAWLGLIWSGLVTAARQCTRRDARRADAHGFRRGQASDGWVGWGRAGSESPGHPQR